MRAGFWVRFWTAGASQAASRESLANPEALDFFVELAREGQEQASSREGQEQASAREGQEQAEKPA